MHASDLWRPRRAPTGRPLPRRRAPPCAPRVGGRSTWVARSVKHSCGRCRSSPGERRALQLAAAATSKATLSRPRVTKRRRRCTAWRLPCSHLPAAAAVRLRRKASQQRRPRAVAGLSAPSAHLSSRRVRCCDANPDCRRSSDAWRLTEQTSRQQRARIFVHALSPRVEYAVSHQYRVIRLNHQQALRHDKCV